MYQKRSILFSLFAPGKIKVNRYPNHRKRPRITACSWPQSWAKISVFLPIWGFTKGILRKIEGYACMAENVTRGQTTKNIGLY